MDSNNFITKFILQDHLHNIKGIPFYLERDLNSITKKWKLSSTLVECKSSNMTLPVLTIEFDSKMDNTMFTLKRGSEYQFIDNQAWLYLY